MRMENKDPEQKQHGKRVPLWMSRRLGVAIFLFFAQFWIFTMRTNINLSIVCMINHTAVAHESSDAELWDNNSSQCSQNGNETATAQKDGEFVWNRSRQALVLGIYFWPYAMFQIPAAILVLKIGAYRLLGCVLFLISMFTSLIPIVSHASYVATVVLRGSIGFLSSSIFVSCQYLLGRWVPLHERSRLSSFCWMGIDSAFIIGYVTAGVLCKYGFDGGWPSIFYIHGVGGFIFCALWVILMSDTPDNARGISKDEKEYISKHIQHVGDKEYAKLYKRIPWKNMATSLPVYAVIVGLTTSDWSTAFMQTFVPTYLDDIFSFDVETLGLVSALPPAAIMLATVCGGVLSDYIQNRFLSRSKTRKLFSALSMIIPALLMLGLGFIDCSRPELAVVLLVLCNGIRGFRYAGVFENALDIDPQYASIIFGIANTVASICAFFTSVMVGEITGNSTREEWQLCFYISSAIEVFGALFYIVFANSNVQLSQDKNISIKVISVVGLEDNTHLQSTK